MSLDLVKRLYQHMAWADGGTLRALAEASGSLERPLELYAHLLGTEHVWLVRITGQDRRVAVWPALDLAGCERLAQENREAYGELLRGLDDDALARSVHYTNSAGQSFDSTVEDILLHVMLHGAYHRGQVALLVRDAGCEPVPTDYIAHRRGAPAATRRP